MTVYKQRPPAGTLLMVCDKCGTKWRQGLPMELGPGFDDCTAKPRVVQVDATQAREANDAAQDGEKGGSE